MDDTLQDLKSVLQTLALPVIGQVRLVQDDCSRVERLTGAFNAAHHAIRADGDVLLTAGRAGVLAQLDERLAQLSGPSAPPICSELSMRQSPEWRQIRTIARESLVRFGWPLEVPAIALSGQLEDAHGRATIASTHAARW